MEGVTFTNNIEFEDGEISNDDSDLYTPLERPHVSMAIGGNKQLPTSESDDDSNCKESSSDSDSSTKQYSSKIRKKNLSNSKQNLWSKKKNYNIWSSDLQTDILMNSLVDCNLDKANKRTRDVESYNFNLGMHSKLYNNFNNHSNEHRMTRYSGKRKSNGKFVEVSNDNKESKTNETTNISRNPRKLLSLSTTIDSTEDEIATDIANKLFENKEELVLRALKVLGKEAVLSLFEKTREIEMCGGMLIMNGTRRRTPGGVFFHLIKTSDSLPRSQINEVFSEDKKTAARTKKLAANQMKKIRAAKFKEALTKDDFPTLLTRTELAIKEFKAKRLAEESSEVLNPPPSPATDGKEYSSDGEDPKDEEEEEEEDSKCFKDDDLIVYDDMFE